MSQKKIVRIFAAHELPNITELLGRAAIELESERISIILNRSGKADLVLVLNTVRKPLWVRVPRGGLLKVLQEPTVENPFTHLFTYWHSRIYDQILTHSPNTKDPRQIKSLPYLNSHVDPELVMPAAAAKKFQISVIASTLSSLPGQNLRSKFIDELLVRSPDLEPHTFGKGRKRELVSKIEGLRDYRFSVAIENSSIGSYITEKFYDCIIAGCVPLYYGAPDIGDYFPIDSFISLPINEFEESYRIISQLSESEYLRRLPALSEARSLIRERYSLGALILGYFKHLPKSSGVKRRLVILYPLDALVLFVWRILVQLPYSWIFRLRRFTSRLGG